MAVYGLFRSASADKQNEIVLLIVYQLCGRVLKVISLNSYAVLAKRVDQRVSLLQ